MGPDAVCLFLCLVSFPDGVIKTGVQSLQTSVNTLKSYIAYWEICVVMLITTEPLMLQANVITLIPQGTEGESEWIGSEDEPLLGFSWRGGIERDTTGILMWSKPFFATLPNGEQVLYM